MNLFDGTSARQLDLMDYDLEPLTGRPARQRAASRLRVLQRDLYAELTRRRRRAQIAARHELDRALAED